jgi:hypothetical protein
MFVGGFTMLTCLCWCRACSVRLVWILALDARPFHNFLLADTSQETVTLLKDTRQTCGY